MVVIVGNLLGYLVGNNTRMSAMSSPEVTRKSQQDFTERDQSGHFQNRSGRSRA
jgi:hypothetical protein